jgi:hypothetical protein
MSKTINVPEKTYAPGDYGPFTVTVPPGTTKFEVRLTSSSGAWPAGDAATPIFVLTMGFDGYTPAIWSIERVGIDRTTGLPYKTLNYGISAPTDSVGQSLEVHTATASIHVNSPITCAVQAAALS